MTQPTQADLDAAYAAGKAAYFRDIGTHGPTHAERRIVYTDNPHPPFSLLAEAWRRGYVQSTRRVVAP